MVFCLGRLLRRKKAQKKISSLEGEVSELRSSKQYMESNREKIREPGNQKQLESMIMKAERAIQVKEKELAVWRASLNANSDTKA